MIGRQAQRVTQRVRELPAGLVAVGLGLRQGLGDHGIDGRRQFRPPFGERRRRLVQVGPDRREALGPVEGRLAGQQLERRARERVLVCAPVDQEALDLLGRGVIRRAEELPGRGESQGHLRALAQPEVRQVHVVRPPGLPVQQDVRGLDVPVHQAGRVRGVQRRRHRGDDRGHLLRGQRPFPAQQRPHVPAAHQAHGDEQDVPHLARLVHRDDVRVVNGRGRPRLADEALPEHVVGAHGRRHDLQGHQPVQPHVTRAEHNGHAARTDLLLEPVSPQP